MLNRKKDISNYLFYYCDGNKSNICIKISSADPETLLYLQCKHRALGWCVSIMKWERKHNTIRRKNKYNEKLDFYFVFLILSECGNIFWCLLINRKASTDEEVQKRCFYYTKHLEPPCCSNMPYKETLIWFRFLIKDAANIFLSCKDNRDKMPPLLYQLCSK